MGYKYYYPDDTVEILVIRIEDKTESVHYELQCKTLVKKYLFWGDLVEKFTTVYVGCDHMYSIEVAKFKTAEEAESVANKFRFNTVDVVKTIKIEKS